VSDEHLPDPGDEDGLSHGVLLGAVKHEAQRTALGAMRREQHRRRIDWDVRGILAILSLVGAFALAFTQLVIGQTAEIPAWAAAIVAGVTGFYFGSRGGSIGGGRRNDDDEGDFYP
jgi:hypothetical protein